MNYHHWHTKKPSIAVKAIQKHQTLYNNNLRAT
uniref:Uncharacterized protein n=1 Tax=Arundo donax TaxID=35708 RepID=A0A0A9BE15_ARUDO